MSTRSIIAVPHGDTWRGRYCHSDGYPTWMGAKLWELVKREGLDVARETLISAHYGWSCIDPKQINVSKFTPDVKAKFGTPEYEAGVFKTMYGDGRFECVPNWGIAYTDTVIDKLSSNGNPYQQTTEDEWLTPERTQDTEWFYVLTDAGIIVGECHWDKPVTYKGEFRWDESEPNWKEIEGAE